MQTVTLALVQAVGRWRAALAALKRPSDVPFVWNNGNVLLAAVAGLDFLGTRCRELGEWYGVEYAFRRNPFSRALPLDARPPTPPSAKMKVLIDGEMAEVVNERKLAEREAALRAAAAHDAATAGAPRWWPDAGDQRQRDRVRAAEKVLLEEEARWPPRARTPSPRRAASRGR